MQAVRDIDDADAVALELADQVEQLAHIARLQRLGRLVEEQHFRPGDQRAGDLDDMALRQRQFGDALVDRHAQLVGGDARDQPLGLGGAGRADERRRRKLKIFQHGQIGRQRRMLIHDRDAVLAHLPRIGRADIFAVVIDGAGIRAQNAGGDPDQRRFAGTVLADDGMNLARVNQNIDALERAHRTETLADVRKRHHRHVRRGGDDRRAHGVRHGDVMHSAAAGLFRATPRRPAR